MIAFREEQLNDELAIRLQARSIGVHHQILGNPGHAGRMKFLLALDLYETEPARANIGKTAKVAKPRDPNAVVPRSRENRLPVQRRDSLAIDLQRSDAHAASSTA